MELLRGLAEAPAPTPAAPAPAAAAGKALGPNDNLPFFDKPIINVCIVDNMPDAGCKYPNGTTMPTAEFTGFEVAFFRKAAAELGWPEDRINWQCKTFDEAIKALSSPVDLGCDISPNGWNSQPSRLLAGWKLAFPTKRPGFCIAVPVQTGYSWTVWQFFSYMTWEVWVLLVCVGIISGFVTWLLEVGAQALNHDTRWMANVMWDTLGRPVQMRDFRLSSTGANIVALAWSLLAYITFALYVANLTADLTTTTIRNQIQGVADLRGKPVISWTGYAQRLSRYNVQVTKGMAWGDTPDDVKIMMDTMLDGDYAAVVLDCPTLKVYDATDCRIRLLDTAFDLVDQVSAWPKWFNNSETIEAYNSAVIEALGDTLGVQELYQQYIDVMPTPCKNNAFSTNSQVTIVMVSGLYILLCIAMGVAAFLIAWHWTYKLIVVPWAKRSGAMQRYFPCIKSSAAQKVMDKTRTFKQEWVKVGSFKMMPRRSEPRPEDIVWDDRYAGSAGNYLDASADVKELERRQHEVQAYQQYQEELAHELVKLQRLLAAQSAVAGGPRPSSPAPAPAAAAHEETGGSAGAQHRFSVKEIVKEFEERD